MPRRAFDYNQSVIGDCGHVCAIWPQVRKFGRNSGELEVICDTCTREQYGIDDSESMSIWVRIKETETDPYGMKEAKAKEPKKSTPRKKAEKKPSIWAQLMMDEPNG